MRKLIWVLLALTLLSATMFAQKAGIEFGYSYIRVNPGAPADAISMNGFEAQPIFMLKHHFAIAADFTGSFNSNYHGVDVKDFFYAAGPAYVIPLGKAAMANVHFIVGGNHLGLSEGGMSETYNAFAMAPGGALDFKIAKKVYFRAAEIDYVYTKHDLAPGHTQQNNFRYGAGLLFMF